MIGEGQTINHYMLSFGIRALNIDELNHLRNQIIDILRRYNYRGVSEKSVNKAVFLTQFPDIQVLPRSFLMMSDDIATALCV